MDVQQLTELPTLGAPGAPKALPPANFMGRIIKTDADLHKALEDLLKVRGNDAVDSLRKTIDMLINRPQSRMSQTLLGDIEMLLKRWSLPLGRDYWIKLSKALESQHLDEPALTEIAMSPGALKQFADQADSYGIRAGFEAELAFTDIDASTGEWEPNWDADVGLDVTTTMDEIKDFFSETINANDRFWARLDEEHLEALDEKAREFIEDNFQERALDRVLSGRERRELERDYLSDQGLDDERVKSVMAAGADAPTFWSKNELEKYIQDNPDYGIYHDMMDVIDDQLIDEIESVRDDIEEELRQEYYEESDYTIGAWLMDRGINSMSDLKFEYELEWPHYDQTSSDGYDTHSMEMAADGLSNQLEMPVRVATGYHSAERKDNLFIIEPDSSIRPEGDHASAEIVSPPMSLGKAIDSLGKVLDWAREHGGYTNSSTGLHVGVSLPDMSRVDYVKLAILLGDEYVLKQFQRSTNHYTESVFRKIASTRNSQTVAQAVDALKKGLAEQASTALKYTVFSGKGTTGKYVSINWRENYVEFRSMGNDYIDELPKITNTIYRYVRALVSAADPDMDRREYLTKLYKIVQDANTGVSGPKAEPVNLVITKYLSGDISKEELGKYKDYLVQVAQSRKDPGAAKPTPPELVTKRWQVAIDGRKMLFKVASAADALAKARDVDPSLASRPDSDFTVSPYAA